MLQTVLLCLRLDSPAFPVPLTLPSFPLGDAAPRSLPLAKPWLSQSLRSLLEEQENTVLQEMVLVKSHYLIGEMRLGFDVSLINMNSTAVFTFKVQRSCVKGSLLNGYVVAICKRVEVCTELCTAQGLILCLCTQMSKLKNTQLGHSTLLHHRHVV